MSNYVKTPHTSIFSGPTSCGKTKKVLDLLESEYRHHFQNIVILCSTLRWNKTYLERSFLWQDDYIFLIEPKEQLFARIKKLSQIFAGEETLFIIDDVIANENLDKKRQSLLELAISGRHREHSLWLLTQSYTAIPKNLRRQKKQLFVWYPAEKSDLKIVDEETNILPAGEMNVIKERLKQGKHTCLYIQLEHPRTYQVLE